jgi:hypothetical protein
MKIFAAVEEWSMIRKILEHLGLPTHVPRPALARSSPQGEVRIDRLRSRLSIAPRHDAEEAHDLPLSWCQGRGVSSIPSDLP